MTKRWPELLGVCAVAALVLVPLFGLVTAIVAREPDPFTGLTASLADLIGSSGVAGLLLNSVVLSIVVAVGAVLLGGWLAWVEHRCIFPGHRAIMVITLLPLAMPSYILAGTARSALGPGGWIGRPLGLPHFTGFGVAAIVLAVVTAPLVQLIIGASLARASSAEEEAARSLGAPAKAVFWAVVFPRLRPAIGFSTLIALLYAVSDFGAVAVLDCPVLTWRLYDAVRGHDLARAAILGVAVLVATVPLFYVARRIRGGAQEASVANIRPITRRPLRGAALAATLLAVGLTAGLGVLLPITTLALWVIDGLQRSLVFASPWTSLLQTTGVALLGALLTLALAWLPARVIAAQERRAPSARHAWLEEATYMTSALPGVLLALGLMQAALWFARTAGSASIYHGLLGSGALLFAGYAARFLAEVFAPLRTSLSLLDPRQIESARVLGAGRWAVWWRVTLPQIAPGVAVAFLIGFNAIVKELPVTLLLGGATGLRTLSFRVWDRYAESLWHDAGVAGLMIVGLAMVSLLLTLTWRRDV